MINITESLFLKASAIKIKLCDESLIEFEILPRELVRMTIASSLLSFHRVSAFFFSILLTNFELSSLPDSISELKELKELNIHGNRPMNLPDIIGELKAMTYLSLGSNKISKLPKSIGNLINLKSLILTSNLLVDLPNTMSQMINLEYLYLHYNKLESIPKLEYPKLGSFI